MNLENTYFSKQTNEQTPSMCSSQKKEAFKNTLAKNLEVEQQDHRVLAFKEKAPESQALFSTSSRVLYSDNIVKESITVKTRDVPSTCDKTLDCPNIKDDYYLNLLSWSSNNIIAIALETSIYLYNATNGNTIELFDTQNLEDYISSVSFSKDGSYLSFGTSSHQIQIWDVNEQKRIRSFSGHISRISALDWNEALLSSGSRDGLIINHDTRLANHDIAHLEHHTQEICGLKWSNDGSYLASGANDNAVCIWNGTLTGEHVEPRSIYTEHTAAVKALAWSPHQRNILASGGGTADRTIKLWNINNNSLLNSIDTGSQVSGLLWNKYEKEILSSHGYSKNQLCLWSYPSMNLMQELKGHTGRILNMCVSPDGETVCTSSVDETLRFWKVFGNTSKYAKSNSNNGKLMKSKVMCLR